MDQIQVELEPMFNLAGSVGYLNLVKSILETDLDVEAKYFYICLLEFTGKRTPYAHFRLCSKNSYYLEDVNISSLVDANIIKYNATKRGRANKHVYTINNIKKWRI